jgi:hypothetical protein
MARVGSAREIEFSMRLRTASLPACRVQAGGTEGENKWNNYYN